ncbi:hypothetical protein Bbelb_104380 [Branchiostoma belcheri]|nr:hypothetical protein Bbelb_104380 [Branchiostoma belcheri]
MPWNHHILTGPMFLVGVRLRGPLSLLMEKKGSLDGAKSQEGPSPVGWQMGKKLRDPFIAELQGDDYPSWGGNNGADRRGSQPNLGKTLGGCAEQGSNPCMRTAATN